MTLMTVVPHHMRDYVPSVRAYKALKRKEARALEKAAETLNIGSAYLTREASERISRIRKDSRELLRELSVQAIGR